MSPKDLREHREALVKFHNVYMEYLGEAIHNNGSADPQNVMRLRGEVIASVPAAQGALTVAGVNIVYTPPPAFGGPVMSGLPNTVFLHEQPGYRLSDFAGGKPTYAGVIDMVRLGAQYLEDRELKERKRRRNPLYWIDRVLRMTLGIPAYIVSRLVGVPRQRVEQSSLGKVLRIIGVLGDIAGAYGLGKLLGLY